MRPTERTLQYLQNHASLAGIVERFNRHAGPFGRHFDLFGLFDVIAIRPNRKPIGNAYEIVAVQCCGGSTRAEHEQKMMSMTPEKKGDRSNYEKLRWWLRAGGEAELWAWRKRVRLKKDLTPSKTPQWTCSVTRFILITDAKVGQIQGELV